MQTGALPFGQVVSSLEQLSGSGRSRTCMPRTAAGIPVRCPAPMRPALPSPADGTGFEPVRPEPNRLANGRLAPVRPVHPRVLLLTSYGTRTRSNTVTGCRADPYTYEAAIEPEARHWNRTSDSSLPQTRDPTSPAGRFTLHSAFGPLPPPGIEPGLRASHARVVSIPPRGRKANAE